MRLLDALFFFFLAVSQVKTEYTAVVVEFYPEQTTDLEPEERLRRNVDGYLKIFDEVQKHKPDIVVFPEGTLATNAITLTRKDLVPYAVPINIINQSLCTTEDTTFLTRLACAAQQSKTYMVINLYEREPCKIKSQCSEDGWNFYNTNVVLDRNGTPVSKYRKYNLFGEEFMNRTQTADISIFESDFEGEFAQFICFDIMFKEPTLDLIRKHKVRNIIFPSMWFSELPFLTALQSQQQWAYAVNATLLAAGANNPKLGSGGTGIYQGTKGALVIDILGNTDSKAFVAKIPNENSAIPESVKEIDEKAKQMDGFFLKSDYLKPYTSKIIEVDDKEMKDAVCHKGFCCNFSILIEWNDTALVEKKNYYVYHMVAYQGVRTFDGFYNGGIEICGLVACANRSLDSCGKRFPDYDNVSWPVTFKYIKIDAEYLIDDKRFQYPNSLMSNIKPLPVDAIDWTNDTSNKMIYRTYTLKKPQNRLMTFAIYGRDFNQDSPPDTNNRSGTFVLQFYLIVLVAFNIFVLSYCLLLTNKNI